MESCRDTLDGHTGEDKKSMGTIFTGNLENIFLNFITYSVKCIMDMDLQVMCPLDKKMTPKPSK